MVIFKKGVHGPRVFLKYMLCLDAQTHCRVSEYSKSYRHFVQAPLLEEERERGLALKQFLKSGVDDYSVSIRTSSCRAL